MMKKCPHCHEESFGWRELIVLDYFSPNECKACGQLVRNDGVRQFLTVPTILGALFLGMVVFSVLPGSLQSLGFLFVIVFVALSVILLAKPAKFEDPKAGFPLFLPDLDNDKEIMVRGWPERELGKIVDDFRRQDAIDVPMEIEIQKRDEHEFLLTFPADIAPWDFAALVNYLNYPINFDLPDRTVAIAGKTTLTTDFHGIPDALLGKKAFLYVPEDDDDYTSVYLRTGKGESFASSFDEFVWHPVREARLSGKVNLLFDRNHTARQTSSLPSSSRAG